MSTQNTNATKWKEIFLSCSRIHKIIVQELKEVDTTSEKNRTILNLLVRIDRNIVAISVLASSSIMNSGSIWMKLPVGLLIRSCLSDCILGLHISDKNENTVSDLNEILRKDYVAAMFDEFEVYKDKISGIGFDDIFAEHLYTLQIEDNFIESLTFNDKLETITPGEEHKMWSAKSTKDISDAYPNMIQTKYLFNSVKDDSDIGELAEKLYSYFKYFSQYEHYSDNGHGDSMADFGEDNIKFEKTFDYILQSVFVLSGNKKRQ